MMKSEFIERVGFEPTAAEYAEIEAEYMGCDIDKDQFCKEWKKNGGVQRLMRLRARRIEELEDELEKEKSDYDRMDIEYCKKINEIHRSWKNETDNLKLRLKECQEANDNLAKLLEEANAGRKEAEDKVQTIKAAFAILGIGKEEA